MRSAISLIFFSAFCLNIFKAFSAATLQPMHLPTLQSSPQALTQGWPQSRLFFGQGRNWQTTSSGRCQHSFLTLWLHTGCCASVSSLQRQMMVSEHSFLKGDGWLHPTERERLPYLYYTKLPTPSSLALTRANLR
jgi:hypothetical protein